VGCCASLLANLIVGLAPTGGLGWIACIRAQEKPENQLEQTGPYRLGLLQIESDAVNDDKVSPLLMTDLRDELAKRQDYSVVDTHVTLTQLSLAEDCSVTELSCLQQIAEKLKLDGLLFGRLTHDDGEVPMASFRRFDASKGAIQSTAIISFGSDPFSEERMQAEAHQLLNKLLGPARKPALAAAAPVAPVQSAPEAAPPSIAAEQAAAPVVADPQPDIHRDAVVNADLSTGNGLSARKVAGYVLLGGAAASVGLSVLSFIQVDRAANNASFQDYRLLVGSMTTGVKDVCDEANAGKRYGKSEDTFRQVKSSCNTGSTFEVLQYVFIGGALVTGGLAPFLLFGGGSSNQEQAAATGLRTLTLHPSIKKDGASLNARVRF
jgi:hypothetical protein